jgi:hypothetical protein
MIVPFFFNEEDDKRALIVSISPETCTVDLFDKERETDSKIFAVTSIDHDISDCILHMMDLASQMSSVFFNEEHVDGGVETIPVVKEEDMLVSMCYIAECLAFNK